MKKLVDKLRSIGKEALLEVVEYDEEKIAGYAKMAVDMSFDYINGHDILLIHLGYDR